LLPPPTFSLTHTPTTHIYTLSLHDALPIFVFHRQQLVALALHHLGHRDAGRTRYHLGDLLGTDFGAQHAVLGLVGRSLGLGRLRSEEHTSEFQSRENLVCRLLLEKKKRKKP